MRRPLYLCSTSTLSLEVKTVPPEVSTVRWGAALSQETEAEPRLETLQGSRAAPPSRPEMLYSPAVRKYFEHFGGEENILYLPGPAREGAELGRWGRR